MLLVTGTFKWRIGEIRVREGDRPKVFEWLTKKSPIRRTLTGIEFSFQRGWSVELLWPFDQTAESFDELQVQTLTMLGFLPNRNGDESFEMVDFVLPPETPLQQLQV